MMTAKPFLFFIPGSIKSREGASGLVYQNGVSSPALVGRKLLLSSLQNTGGERAKGSLVWDYGLIFQGSTEV